MHAGEPMLIEKAVCMHEEDAGLLWKHVEYRTNHSEVRRSRRLVLSFIATVTAPAALPTCMLPHLFSAYASTHLSIYLQNAL